MANLNCSELSQVLALHETGPQIILCSILFYSLLPLAMAKAWLHLILIETYPVQYFEFNITDNLCVVFAFREPSYNETGDTDYQMRWCV